MVSCTYLEGCVAKWVSLGPGFDSQQKQSFFGSLLDVWGAFSLMRTIKMQLVVHEIKIM
jgi:hypothetical protein